MAMECWQGNPLRTELARSGQSRLEARGSRAKRFPRICPYSSVLVLGEGLDGARPNFWRQGRALLGLGKELLSVLCACRMEKTGSQRQAWGGRLAAQQGPWAVRSAPLARCAAATFWGKQAGEGMGLNPGDLQGIEATLPSALTLTESILQPLGPWSAQSVPLSHSVPLAVAHSWHCGHAPRRRLLPGSVAHWVNGGPILIPWGCSSSCRAWSPCGS